MRQIDVKRIGIWEIRGVCTSQGLDRRNYPEPKSVCAAITYRVTKTLAAQIAAGIEHQLEAGEWAHCAIYERDLTRLWPLDQEDREKQIAQFAEQYGFQLRYYNKGLCAIFIKELEGS